MKISLDLRDILLSQLFYVLYTRDILIHGQGYNNSVEGYFDTGIILRSQGYFKRDILNPNRENEIQ